MTDTNFNFFADSSDILIKKLSSRIEEIKIFDGDIKLNLDNGLIWQQILSLKLISKNNFLIKIKNFLIK